MKQLTIIPPPNHQVCAHQAMDGTLRVWDITAARDLVAEGHAVSWFSLIENIVTIETIGFQCEDIDEEYAMTTKLSQPLIFVPLCGDILLIDGWHRLWKAAKLAIDLVPMFELTDEEADSIFLFELQANRGLEWWIY